MFHLTLQNYVRQKYFPNISEILKHFSISNIFSRNYKLRFHKNHNFAGKFFTMISAIKSTVNNQNHEKMDKEVKS